MKIKLFIIFILFTAFFTLFSYTVAKEYWQKTDFDTMVKLQDRIPKRYDSLFSYFSLLGSAEITIGFCIILAVAAFFRRKWRSILGWFLIAPATLGEIFGKLIVYHPGPPAFFHRSILPTGLPSFYVHTNFSYPSGHMTRTVFIVTVISCIIFFSAKKTTSKALMFIPLILLLAAMGLTRVYLGEHWLSDVLGGALLGAATGFLASVLILEVKKG